MDLMLLFYLLVPLLVFLQLKTYIIDYVYIHAPYILASFGIFFINYIYYFYDLQDLIYLGIYYFVCSKIFSLHT